ncbi:diguanylate cyclase [Poseidonibacter lekithochrous]|uniref:diguanylate cyclase n=1 Tax=Poseidonibacter lekithochrous TaxID=1904463 RepID=UPI000D385ACD|nr:diguanylate cyclase [Poseidonibacter lekithochrous]
MNKTIPHLITIIILILIQNLYAKHPIENNNLKNITLQLQWKHQFQFAGYYIAKEKGYYKDIGLDVNIKEYTYNKDIVQDVLNKKAHYAVGRSSLVINKAKGDKITLLAAIFQSSADVLIALKNSNISSLKDLKNKRIMITGNAQNDLIYLSMLFSNNLSIEDLIIQKHSFDIEDLVNKNTDLMASYISNEPYRLKKEYGLDSIVFAPKDYGFDFYGDILFTHEDRIKSNTNEVMKFKKASLKGWKYAFANIEETINLIQEKYNTQNKSKEALQYEAIELQKLAYYNTKELGLLDVNKIERIYDAYKLMGIAKEQIDFKSFIFDDTQMNSMFTKKEKAFLKRKKTLRLCIDPNWMPFEMFTDDGKYIGLSSEYFKLFSEQLKIPIKAIRTNNWSETLDFMKKRKCDILSLAMETPNRKQYMDFTSVYMQMPLVLATKLNVTFVDNFKQLKNKKIGIVKDYAYAEIIKNKFPYINIVEAKNTKDGLAKVVNEEIFAFIGAVADISYFTQKDFVGEVKISGKFKENLNLSIAVRNDETILLSIFNKLIENLEDDFKTKITNKYMAIKYDPTINHSLLWKSSLIFVIIILITFYWTYTIKKEKRKTELLLIKLEFARNQLKEKNKELKHIARTDKLTELYNRVKLDDALIKELSRANRYNHSLGIILIDIDNFKQVNDTYGHLVGDMVLIDLAKILKEYTRDIDIAGRWGGEEFMIICPETNIKGVNKLAHLLKEKIETYNFPEIRNITASFGISQFRIKDSPDDLILKADEALYKAKNAGRNCVRGYTN